MSVFRRRRRGANLDSQEDVPDVPIRWDYLITYVRPYIPRMLLALFATIISAGLSLVFPAVVGGVGEIPGVLNTVIENSDRALLNTITAVLILIFLIRTVMTFLESYNLAYIGESIILDLRRDLYSHLQHLSLYFFTQRRVGELMSRLSSDVKMIQSLLTTNISTLLQQFFILVGSIIVMFIINARLSLFIIVVIPVAMVLGIIMGRILRRLSAEVQDELASASTVAEESLQNVREVKSFARESYEISRYGDAVVKAFDVQIRSLRYSSVFRPLIGFLAFAGLSLILWFGGLEVLAGRLDAGELVAFLIYGITVAGSFGALINLYSTFQQAIGATKRVFELLDTKPTVTDKANAQPVGKINGRITFDDVSFRYDDNVDVIQNINLDVQAGEIIALVGPSGAGKSTLMNLIPRFYDASEGRVSIDGVDVRDVQQVSLREKIGTVPQEILLFGGTIRENILYGMLDATKEQMIEAAKAANAHEFIEKLPEKYDTIVGQRGIRLSGGQRQRVAIARTILKDPRILLLDEATSSLDNESEHLVQEAFARLMQNRTTLIIAHRLSTVQIANRIAVLDDGEIVELGSHDELMAQNGLYARLYEMQFRHNDEMPTAAGAD